MTKDKSNTDITKIKAHLGLYYENLIRIEASLNPYIYEGNATKSANHGRTEPKNYNPFHQVKLEELRHGYILLCFWAKGAMGIYKH